MKYCDLHNHSIYSDGSKTPRELILLAKEKNLDAIALTDHNTIGGLADLEACAKELSLDVALGSELTCEYIGKEIHMQCLFIDLKCTQGMEKYIETIRKIKRKANDDLARALNRDGYEISLDELENRFGENVNRSHFARALTEKGYTQSSDEAFATLLKEGGGYYFGSIRPQALDTVKEIVSWGFVPVMAHPLLSLARDELESFLPLAKAAGLVGIEVYYSKFTDEEIEYLKGVCEKYGLEPSGGSDYHADMKPGAQMGDAHVPYSCYENLRKYAK